MNGNLVHAVLITALATAQAIKHDHAGQREAEEERINSLPTREERQFERQKKFFKTMTY